MTRGKKVEAASRRAAGAQAPASAASTVVEGPGAVAIAPPRSPRHPSVTVNVVGLDLSLSSTGVATPSGTTTVEGARTAGEQRLALMRTAIMAEVLSAAPVELVVIEDYAYSVAGQKGIRSIAELGGVVKLALYEAEVPYVVVSGSTLKKYATGRGNAPKAQVFAAAVVRSGVEFRSDDEADAWWLYAAAMDHYGYPVVKMPLVNRAALQSVDWPDLPREEEGRG